MALSDEIKARLDIVDVVAKYLPDLKKSGKNLTARCPFHQERSPSFIVFPERQTWHCFGACGIGGDIFSFVMKAEQVGFTTALRNLAQEAGIAIPPSGRIRSSGKSPLEAVNEAALRFFQEALETDRGSLARDYLDKRGLEEGDIKRFELGYSTSGGGDLARFLEAKGIKAELMLAAGLVTEIGDRRLPRDFFKSRLMFAIRDSLGNLVGFAGRALDGSNPKYLNTPQTALFDKGHLLYGTNLANESFKREGIAVIVEGYMDVIAAHQHGYRNVVASMGTALTEHQVALLKQRATTVILALDPDLAGQEATLRSLEGSWSIVGKQHLSDSRRLKSPLYERTGDLEMLRIAILPGGKDPDELIRSDPTQWHSLINEAVSVVDYLFQALGQRIDVSSSHGKMELTDRLFPLIASMQNPYEQDRYFQKLALTLGVSSTILEASVGRPRTGMPQSPRRRTQSPIPAVPTPFNSAKRDVLGEYVMALLLQEPELRTRALELSEEYLVNHESRALLRALCETDTMGLDTVNPPEELTSHIEYLQGIELPPADRKQQEQELTVCIRRLEERYLRELKARETAVLEAAPTGDLIPGEQITQLNDRLKEIFTRADQSG